LIADQEWIVDISKWMLMGIGMAALAAAGCNDAESTNPVPTPVTVTPPPYGMPYDNLFDWHLFTDDTAQTPADDLLPYEVNAPLFTDYTTKTRFLHLPKDTTITYQADTAWDFPVGTVLVKNFAMPADVRKPTDNLRMLETRVLFHEPDGWTANTYVWSKDQKSATRVIVGQTIDVTFVGEDGKTIHDAYRAPKTNDCKLCHGFKTVTPLGPKTRQLNRDHDFGGTTGVKNQIDEYAALGFFDAAPPGAAARTALVDPYGTASLDLRVRAYWDSNCGHCHTANGDSGNSALLLDYLSTDPKMPDANWGICKHPTAAPQTCGHAYDVVPGDAKDSIMVCRISKVGEGTMPPVGVELVNQPGVDLITQWIDSLPKKTCH
jgi:uncharacterized repeat protein (TIGR03806 family)